ncbi:DNA polymerase III subunit alpha [Sterolibacterium denitrificans]|uniref:DNA polymerase III subunit alpha n=2 Tax=Sterolibacterium denitrificans TaxID=157592 RepID=A0A7Z7HSZ3_9PROT|nr:DNA polymerase III subunit alpha [Sterolibacterium denitrificans]KYC29399.1 DNA polymerase III subunit alpha [Sterolibacterium denitrificans]SMB31326.1 DNA polymerase III subunit alpha [Sterolibacterium denitrificans]
MPAPKFIHLRLHSEYSITDGIVRLDAAVARAVADGMPALALTDLANLFGMVKFYSGARSAGLQPIIGCDAWIADDSPDRRDGSRDAGCRLLLLVKDRAGYLRLCELLSNAYLAARRRGRAEITRAALAQGDNAGLIALSGAHFGDVGQLLLAGKSAQAEQQARAWATLFPGSFYLEIQRCGQPQAEMLITQTAALAGRLGLPLVATHPIQFMAPDDFKAHEARVCIAEGYVLADKRRPQNFTEQQYFKSQAEMAELFADLPDALENTVEIARRCNLSVELGKSRLPQFPIPDGLSDDAYLDQQAHEGLEHRLAQLYPDAAVRDEKRPEYLERLAFEINTIQQMGFPGYFLIVADFINWAKQNGVPVGPGRGSGAGSLVAYAMGITDLDPLAYDLLFERFLNPERVSMPDFDIDFCQDGRDRVIDYVKGKYGAHAVSQIATFGTMATKAVIRDVGRVLDLPFNFVDQFAKLIPNELGISLAEAREKEPAINDRIEQEEEIRELWDLAERLEGLTRNIGMHAGGVLIAPGKLTDFCPLYSAQGEVDGQAQGVVSQFDKDDVEKVGLVKFDFLGLRTLTILDEAVRWVRQLDPALKDFRLEDIPLDDQATYALFAAGNTTAVFQSESRSAKDLEKRLKGDTFEDIIALMALNRPGPLGSGMVDDFINRKHGRAKAEYFHPDLEPVLKPTYGVIVYQEQVMLVAQVLAGYTLGGADMLRRAMGKKKPEEMAQQRAIFTEGAARREVDAALATQLFDLMEKFAEYGFNKSHSAAYALVAFQTAWLKHYHCAAFMAATMSSEMADTDKVQLFYQDSLANDLRFLPPDINTGGIRFEPVDARTIRYGLGAIKGTGETALSAILRARETGPFTDLFDFCRRIDKRVVNRRVIEALIRAGAFDALDAEHAADASSRAHRARLLASVGVALEAAEQAERHALQDNLFGDDSHAGADHPHYVETPHWSEREHLLNEKQALGFFISGHPYNAYRAELAPFVRKPLAQIEPQRDPLLLAGIVVSTRTQMTRRGKMAIVMIDDASAQLEVTVFNERFEAERNKIVVDELLLVEGKVMRDDFSGGLRVVADKLLTLGEARGRFARMLQLSLNGNSNAERLRSLLAPYRAGSNACPVRLAYRNGDAEVQLRLSDAWQVRLEDELLANLHDWLTPANVKVVYG